MGTEATPGVVDGDFCGLAPSRRVVAGGRKAQFEQGTRYTPGLRQDRTNTNGACRSSCMRRRYHRLRDAIPGQPSASDSCE